jgi:hypothetical protein
MYGEAKVRRVYIEAVGQEAGRLPQLVFVAEEQAQTVAQVEILI